MKKLVSFATAISLIASITMFSAHAEEQTALEKLAVSLGSETDHISALNKNYPLPYELTDHTKPYSPFIPTASGDDMPEGVGIAEYSDTSLATSVISVLTHNGVISASDILENTATLSEITDLLSVKFPIYKYQNLIAKSSFRLYIYNLLKNQTLEQKTDSLISTAEKCMNERKYFLIMYSAFRYSPTQFEVIFGRTANSEFTHSAVGMGITDGEWSFNGKKYDKCILTLDSYSAGFKSDAFSEDTCIYINSETKECYMPKIAGYAESDINIIAIDNDKLLNFEETDVADDIASINIYSDTITEVSYTDENGNEVILNEDNDFLDNYHQYSNNWFIAKGDNFRIYTSSEQNADYVSIARKDYSLSFQTKKADNEIISSGDTLKIVRKDLWGVTQRKDEDPLIYDIKVSRATPVKNFQLEIYDDRLYGISGETMTEATFTNTDDGLIFGGGKIKLVAYHENEVDGYPFTFQSDNEVLIKYDENFSLFIDRDNDGTFEHEVECGDTNCDGRVDAIDASIVLNAYADLSTNNSKNPKEVYTDLKYADINNDGMINAVDSSIIASIYAKNSTIQ
ncbi:MAG: hypothetical protein K2J32_08415 [Ruminococcus sp.]|nr:hypothetical protein [Ruminococcus sp.]